MSKIDVKTRYEPSEVETRIFERWFSAGIFQPGNGDSGTESYSIAIPPPNVTGSLHMGHALNGSIQDTLIRYHRMLGRRTKWILGTDHAGIATQTQVERKLRSEGVNKEELGRERFEQRVWQWREEYGSQIVKQFQRLGASCDYSDERFTLDEGYVKAVLKVFVDLYEKGYIYRDRYLVNWDPGSQSAISDLEVEEREVEDTLYYIAYPLASGEGHLTVATVRPETMLADTAVAVNPDDERYGHLVGQEVVLPLVGRRLPIVADEYVKPEFGTGALKITPGHDPNDFEIGRRHGLDQLTVIGEDGCMTEQAGERFAGLKVAEAQQAVVTALREEGALVREEPYLHTVPFSHRSGERIEPLISLQWFMDMQELAKPAIEAVKSGQVEIRPERWARVYLEWLENIRPWCISRQLWWGHRLPVWYRKDSDEIYVGMEPPPDEDSYRRDGDVLDTWFSSALWPFATLGWPDQTGELKAFYPTSVLSTARDILFLWVARMVMMGIEFLGEVPFRSVYIHSVIQAPDGRRMSKSLGTGIDPLDEIGTHGADAVRFGLLAMSSSQDVRYSSEKVQQGQQFANKLWNASRLILQNVSSEVKAAPLPTTVEDRWILSRLQEAKRSTAERIEQYDFSHAALGLYDFVYGELCDWYLELVKPRLSEKDADHNALSATLLYLLEETLAMAHPLIPFVTEEIWSYLPNTDGLLAASPFPQPDSKLDDPQAEQQLEQTIEAVRALRQWRDRVGARPGLVIPAFFVAEGYGEVKDCIARLARFDFSVQGESWQVDGYVAIPIPGGTVKVPVHPEIDLQSMEERIAQLRKRLEGEIKRCEGKLGNDKFVAKAPADVVAAEREKLARYRDELAELDRQ